MWSIEAMLNLYYPQSKSGTILGRHSARERAAGDRDCGTAPLTVSRLFFLLEDKDSRSLDRVQDDGGSGRSSSDDCAV
jgi:hypothetical protein